MIAHFAEKWWKAAILHWNGWLETIITQMMIRWKKCSLRPKKTRWPFACRPDEKSAYPDDSEFVTEMREDSFIYNAELYKRKHHRPRKKRLRRKRGGKNKYL